MKIGYRDIVKQIYFDRNQTNPDYSMRAFARDLDLPPSTLSEVLSAKKGFSPQRASKIAKLMKLPEWQTQFFCDLVIKDHAKSPSERSRAQKRLQEYKHENSVHVLSQTAQRALTSWVDLAILELTYLDGFKATASYISSVLDVTEDVASSSLNRLKAAKLLVQKSLNGKWEDASPFFSSSDGVPSESIRRFHRSVLQLAIKKIESDDVENRTVKTAIFSISKENKTKAKKILDEAISKIAALADGAQEDRSDVMCFSGQLYSLIDTGVKK